MKAARLPPPASSEVQQRSVFLKLQGATDGEKKRKRAGEPHTQKKVQFECLHPGCLKRYGSTSAVGLHARKQHREWVGSLPSQGPAQYCREVEAQRQVSDDEAQRRAAQKGLELDEEVQRQAELEGLHLHHTIFAQKKL